MEQNKALIRFVNELQNQMKGLSEEKFDDKKKELIVRQFDYLIDKVKEQDVGFMVMLCIYLNCYKLHEFGKDIMSLTEELDNIFKNEIIKKLTKRGG